MDDFIGQFSEKNPQLEVVGWNGKRNRSGAKIYDVCCHVCKSDSELFGDGKFSITKAHFKSGRIPCGCSKPVYYTKNQQIVRIKRVCKQRNIEFLGFSGEWFGNRTKLLLKCLKDGFIWKTCNISNLLSGKGCPSCKKDSAKIRSSYEEDEAISIFNKTGKFAEGTEFKKLKSGKWSVVCPICLKDDLTTANLCTGEFTSATAQLVSGTVPCRCSGKFKLSKIQKEFRIKEKIRNINSFKFIGWEKDVLLMSCEKHGIKKMTFSSIYNSGCLCNDCASSGYKTDKIGYFYILFVKGLSHDFIGFGITNHIEDRLSTHRTNLKKSSFEILHTLIFCGDGLSIQNLEREVKQTVKIFPQDVESFRTEATEKDNIEEILTIIRKWNLAQFQKNG